VTVALVELVLPAMSLPERQDMRIDARILRAPFRSRGCRGCASVEAAWRNGSRRLQRREPL
jgi:hypothetical protein